jgi:hypothetical protein
MPSKPKTRSTVTENIKEPKEPSDSKDTIKISDFNSTGHLATATFASVLFGLLLSGNRFSGQITG